MEKNKKMQNKTKMEKPTNTLFMLMSLDGKITSGNSDVLDADKDWITIDGVKEGIHQYYEIEKTTDFYSLNTGRVMEKIGVNTRKNIPTKINCRFIIIDRKPHLNINGIKYLCNWVDKLFLVTDNKNHPAYRLTDQLQNLEILYYENIKLRELMNDLKTKYDVEKITIQSGGTLNCQFLREGLIDYVNIIVAPILVGGSQTSTIIDGESINKIEELSQLKPLKLLEVKRLEDSYIQLKYKVINR